MLKVWYLKSCFCLLALEFLSDKWHKDLAFRVDHVLHISTVLGYCNEESCFIPSNFILILTVTEHWDVVINILSHKNTSVERRFLLK